MCHELTRVVPPASPPFQGEGQGGDGSPTPTAGWIKCTDQLPDDDTVVMTYTPGDTNDPVWPGYHEDGQWYDLLGCAIRQEVTHWQHLPDPPGEAPPSDRSDPS